MVKYSDLFWHIKRGLAVMAFSSMLFLISCAWGEIPRQPQKTDFPLQQNFGLEDLLLDETDFPHGWHASQIGPRPPADAPLGGYKSIDRISINFYENNSVAVQDIHRFEDPEGAASEFERQRSIWFPKSDFWSSWEKPSEISYRSDIADQYFVACASKGVDAERKRERCHMIEQYDEYFVRFSSQIDSSMNYQNFEMLLRAIDKHMEK